MSPSLRASCVLSIFLGLGCSEPQVNSSGGGNGTGSGANGGGGPSTGGNSPGGGFVLPEPGANPSPNPTGPSTPSTDANCGIKRINLEKRPADLLLVLDRSGSMVETANDPMTGMAVEKWVSTVGALDAVVQSTQGQVAWGLKLYPVGEQCEVAATPQVPVAAANHAAVLAAINGNPATRGGGSTPTAAAVRNAAAFFQANPSTNNRYLLVATDGEPNCAMAAAGGGGRRNNSDRAGAVKAIADAAAAGIPSFVVGIATAGSDAHDTLNMMADAGERPRADPTTKYFPVASRTELVATLEQITGQIASCTFPLNPPPPVAENVAVEVDGVRIGKDTNQQNGWNYGANNRSIVLYGEACDRLKSGAAKDVQILYGCPGAIIP